jgi:hypothetical protein
MRSRGPIAVHGVIVFVVAPALAALLTPSTDLLVIVLLWPAFAVLVELAFFLYLWLVRKDRGRRAPLDSETDQP